MISRLSKLFLALLGIVAVSAPLSAKSTSVARPWAKYSIAATCSGRGLAAFLANTYSNVAAGIQSSIMGGNHNQVCDDNSTIAAGAVNLVSSGNDTATLSLIGAGTQNIIGGTLSFIGSGSGNMISSSSSSVASGLTNTVGGSNGFIGSGSGNTVLSAAGSIIGGGEINSVGVGYSMAIVGGYGNGLLSCGYCASTPGPPQFGFIGGGMSNSAVGEYEVVLGGGGNVASGAGATVLGGYHNLAKGPESLAAGFGSYALGAGTFVWSDFSPGAHHLTAPGVGQFLARASGGSTFFSNSLATTGVMLPSGSGAWASASDRFVKSNISAIPGELILERLRSVPITTWSYDSEAPVRHIGPMAQDFFRSFQVGEDDRRIATIDEGGVAIAAIQALRVQAESYRVSNMRLFDRFARLYASSSVFRRRLNAITSNAPPMPRKIRRAMPCVGSGIASFLANSQLNVAGGAEASVLGGSNNVVCDDRSTIGGGSQNTVNSGSDAGLSSFIGAGNQISTSAAESFVGAGTNNQVAGSAAAILGGTGNSVDTTSSSGLVGAGEINSIVQSPSGVIGAGVSNSIVDASDSVLLSGANNVIKAPMGGNASESFIGSGLYNTLTGQLGALYGGSENRVQGTMGTVPGGYGNEANGQLSFAAGTYAEALATGDFVWAGGVFAPPAGVVVTQPNAFVVLAPGGATIYSNSAASIGVTLPPGSGSWSSASDRLLKTNAVSIDDDKLLTLLTKLPVSEWSYNSELDARHIGPMAQDFYALFHLGEDDRHISTIDEDGVALAALKALHDQDRELSEDTDALESALGAIAMRHELMFQRLAEISRSVVADRAKRKNMKCTGVGAGSFLANQEMNVASGAQSSVAGGTNNEVCDDSSFVAGGMDNVVNSGDGKDALSFIGAGDSNLIASGDSFIGAGNTNLLSASFGSAIAAGDRNKIANSIESFVGAGGGNSVVDAPAAVILGGDSNEIIGTIGMAPESRGASDSAIAGGSNNIIAAKADNGARFGFIAGGTENTVTGSMAVVGGGSNNTASGDVATVPGGYGNIAAGTASFAAGYEAHAMNSGSFVWADYSPSATPLTSTRANQFLVRASGGVTFYSSDGSRTGASIVPGSGTWLSTSDRNSKRLIRNVNGKLLLSELASLPITEWSYISEAGVRHIGPMAQDFFTTFHVGEDNRHIATIDEDGVTLGVVQAIREEQEIISRRTDRLRFRLETLENDDVLLSGVVSSLALGLHRR